METLFTILRHRSIRKFKDVSIPESDVILILEAGIRAPSTGLTMPYTVIRVEDERLRRVIYEVSGEQEHVLEAPLLLLFLVDGNRNARIVARRSGKPLSTGLALLINGIICASVAAQNMVVAAEALGYGTCYIGAIQRDPLRIIREFGLPRLTFPVFALVFGVPDEEPEPRPRLPLSIMVHTDRYRELSDEELEEGISVMESSLPWLKTLYRYFSEGGSLDARSEPLYKALEMQGFL